MHARQQPRTDPFAPFTPYTASQSRHPARIRAPLGRSGGRRRDHRARRAEHAVTSGTLAAKAGRAACAAEPLAAAPLAADPLAVRIISRGEGGDSGQQSGGIRELILGFNGLTPAAATAIGAAIGGGGAQAASEPEPEPAAKVEPQQWLEYHAVLGVAGGEDYWTCSDLQLDLLPLPEPEWQKKIDAWIAKQDPEQEPEEPEDWIRFVAGKRKELKSKRTEMKEASASAEGKDWFGSRARKEKKAAQLMDDAKELT